MGIPVEVLPFRLWLLIEMEWIKEMKSRKRTVLTLTHHMGEGEEGEDVSMRKVKRRDACKDMRYCVYQWLIPHWIIIPLLIALP